MSSKAQRVVYLGLETTPAIAVTADRALYAKLDLVPKPKKIMPDDDIGSYAVRRTIVIESHAEGDLEMPAAYYEDAPYMVAMALGAPVITGAGDPYTHAFAIPEATAPTTQAFSVEAYDGDTHGVRGIGMIATEMEISGKAGEAWKIKNKLTGSNPVVETAPTATPALITTTTDILMADTDMWINATFAAIGTTAVTKFISFKWKIKGLFHTKLFGGNLYPTAYGTARPEIELKVVVELGPTAVQQEVAKLQTTSLSAIRIKAAASANDSFTIDGVYHLMEFGKVDDRDGNNIIELTYAGAKDSSDNTGELEIVTNLSAL